VTGHWEKFYITFFRTTSERFFFVYHSNFSCDVLSLFNIRNISVALSGYGTSYLFARKEHRLRNVSKQISEEEYVGIRGKE
jgi:hypothetical protein